MRHTSIDIDLSHVHPSSHEVHVHAQSQAGSSGYNESIGSSKQASHGNGTGSLPAIPSRPEYCTAVPVPAYPHGRRPLPIPPCQRLQPIGGEQQDTRTQSISMGSLECDDDVEDKEALAVKLGLDLVSALDVPSPEQELPGYVDRDVDEREGLTKDAQDSGPATHQVAVSRNPFPNAQHEKTRPAAHQESSEEKLDQRTLPEHIFAEEQLRAALSPMIYSSRSLGQADYSEDEIEVLSLPDTISLSFPSEMAHEARYDIYTPDTALENQARGTTTKHTNAEANEAERSSGSRIHNASFRPVGPFFCGPYGAANYNRSKGYEDLARTPDLHRKPSIYASTYATPQFTSSLERTDSCRSDRSFYASGIDLVVSREDSRKRQYTHTRALTAITALWPGLTSLSSRSRYADRISNSGRVRPQTIYAFIAPSFGPPYFDVIFSKRMGSGSGTDTARVNLNPEPNVQLCVMFCSL